MPSRAPWWTARYTVEEPRTWKVSASRWTWFIHFELGCRLSIIGSCWATLSIHECPTAVTLTDCMASSTNGPCRFEHFILLVPLRSGRSDGDFPATNGPPQFQPWWGDWRSRWPRGLCQDRSLQEPQCGIRDGRRSCQLHWGAFQYFYQTQLTPIFSFPCQWL